MSYCWRCVCLCLLTYASFVCMWGSSNMWGQVRERVYVCVCDSRVWDYCVCVARESASFLIYGLHMVGGGSWWPCYPSPRVDLWVDLLTPCAWWNCKVAGLTSVESGKVGLGNLQEGDFSFGCMELEVPLRFQAVICKELELNIPIPDPQFSNWTSLLFMRLKSS